MKLNLKIGFFRLTLTLSIIVAVFGFLIGLSEYGYPEDGILPAALGAVCIWGVYLLVRFVVYGFLKPEGKSQEGKPKEAEKKGNSE